MEDLNYYNDDITTGNSNQPKEDSTQKHGVTTTVGEHDQTEVTEIYHPSHELNQRTNFLRKELKIKGDKLTYMSV